MTTHFVQEVEFNLSNTTAKKLEFHQHHDKSGQSIVVCNPINHEAKKTLDSPMTMSKTMFIKSICLHFALEVSSFYITH